MFTVDHLNSSFINIGNIIKRRAVHYHVVAMNDYDYAEWKHRALDIQLCNSV